MKVAIVGSRDFAPLIEVAEYVERLPRDSVVVTGGARGVDQTAERAARERWLPYEVYKPDYEQYGRRAPLIRNAIIVASCDRLVAFWDGKSRGTQHVVGLAEANGKPVEIIERRYENRSSDGTEGRE